MVQAQLARHRLNEVAAYSAVWKRLCLLSSINIISLRLQRDRVSFQQADLTIAGSVHEFQKTIMSQLRAVAKRECTAVPIRKY